MTKKNRDLRGMNQMMSGVSILIGGPLKFHGLKHGGLGNGCGQ